MSANTQAIIIAAIGFGAGFLVVLAICASIIIYRIIDAPSHIIEAHRNKDKDPKDIVLYAQPDKDHHDGYNDPMLPRKRR